MVQEQSTEIESGQPGEMVATGSSGGEERNKIRKTRIRSLYLFPMYDFNMAKSIAEIIERDGAGTLSEETLAMTLSLSARSSGFQMKTLTGRQFGLLTKQADVLLTTPLAKMILKPTSEEEKRRALVEAFLKIPLFQAVAMRFKGQPLPAKETLRHILEREFQVTSNRVNDAQRVLLDSARDTGVLIEKGNAVYLSTLATPKPSAVAQEPDTPLPAAAEQPTKGTTHSATTVQQIPGNLPPISEEDLLGLNEDEFQKYWSLFGKMVRVRAKRKGEVSK
ncbi:MAG: hypothetical protein NTU41_08725, partial [Chloroflexi bacterium]|nr:hypothetical protein [Chloroflexota bacterium]